MSSALFSSLFFCSLFSLASTDDSIIKNDEYPSMDCAPMSCGYVKNITYPFWVDGHQPPHCGLPAFKLTCKHDDYPVLETSATDEYQVREIFYKNQSVVVANAQFVNKHCPILLQTLSFSLTPFNVSSVNRELVFVFNCSTPQPEYYRIPCGGNIIFAYFGDWQTDVLSSCKTATLPVLDYLGADVRDYGRVIKNGFLLEWTAPNCAECRESKGQCGYSYANDNFMCICPDRAHWRSCNASDGSMIAKPGELF